MVLLEASLWPKLGRCECWEEVGDMAVGESTRSTDDGVGGDEGDAEAKAADED